MFGPAHGGLGALRAALASSSLSVVHVRTSIELEKELESEGDHVAIVVDVQHLGAQALILARRSASARDLPVVAICPDQPNLLALLSDVDDVLVLPIRADEAVFRLRTLERRRRTARTAARERHDAEAMFELTQALASSLDFREILLTVVRRIAEVVQVRRASIVLTSGPNVDEVGYVIATSDDPTVVNLELDLAKYPEIREVLRTREPLTIHDAHDHPVLDGLHPNALPPESHSALTLFPIVWDGEAVGVLFLRAARERGALGPRETHLCEVIASATAVALRNARAVQSLRDHSQRATFARFEAERRARSLKRYADLFAHVAEGIAACDSKGRVLFSNPRAHEITGLDESMLRNMLLVDIVHPQDRAKARALAAGFALGHFPRAVDFRIVRSTGETIIVSCSFARVSESVDMLLVSFRDVTEERHTENELVKTMEFLESLVHASVDGIIAADMTGTIVLFNPAAERIYGYRAEDVIGRLNVRQLYPEGGAREIMSRLRSEKWGGVGRLEPTRHVAISSSGESLPIQISAAIIYDDGKPVATFGIFTDLREKLRTEERLAEVQQKLEVSERAAFIAELAGTAAHEMNQPLTSILACLQLLRKRGTSPESTEKAMTLIETESQRLADIVRKIGSITRYETTAYVGGQRILDLDRAQGSKPE